MNSTIPTQALYQYAADTWQSFMALTSTCGFPADHLTAAGERGLYTSPSNIAAYLWSTLAARELQIIDASEAQQQIQQTLRTLSNIERHPTSGMFFNWYDPQTGTKLERWPGSGSKVKPFLSSVDNGWLAAALIMVANGVPNLREQAVALFTPMNFGFFLNPDSGLLYGGYWPEQARSHLPFGYTEFDFGTLNTEPRIASYIGIAKGDLLASHYFRMWRTLPLSLDRVKLGIQHANVFANYGELDIQEGYYTCYGMNLVPSWGGSMFEALLVPQFVPEVEWGPASWGINHSLYIQGQIIHGLMEARYGYWGFSPAMNPSGGYREYGVYALGMNPGGYSSNNDHILGDCATTQQRKHTFTNGVVTPHAAFLAMPFAPEAAIQNLDNLRKDFDIYGQWGFWNSVNVQTGQVARCVLALDQGMIMAAIGNVLSGGYLQHLFSEGIIQQAVQPLLAVEKFSASHAPVLSTKVES